MRYRVFGASGLRNSRLFLVAEGFTHGAGHEEACRITDAFAEARGSRLALPGVAIVGLGGTGAYVLDLIAKTPAVEIHLCDGDTISAHNAFTNKSEIDGAVVRHPPQVVLLARSNRGPGRPARPAARVACRPRRTRGVAVQWPPVLRLASRP